MKRVLAKYILAFQLQFVLLNMLISQAQFKGWLIDEHKNPLEGAIVSWKRTPVFAVTDSMGMFSISRSSQDSILSIQYVGFKEKDFIIPSSAIEVSLSLTENIDLQQVEIRAKSDATFTPLGSNLNKEVISLRELRKAPCCNLSESFETSAVVDANYTNAALGTREIEMLGLRGIYSQVMLDSRPTLYTFAAPFAFDFIPGPWLKGVQVSKGAGTVVNGSEGLAGQINVDIIDPQDGPRLFINAYANHRSRYEFNLVTNKKLNENWSFGTLLNANQDQHHQDKNKDGYLDSPQKKQLNLMQRVHYYGLKWEGQINFHGILDQRNGGQVAHPTPGHLEPLVSYNQDNKRLEIFGNIGFVGFKDPDRSIGFQWHIQRHKYDALYAQRANGYDKSYYTNLIYQEKFGTKKHMLQSGLSMRQSITEEGFSDFIFDREEFIPGIFAEYSYNSDVKESKFGFTVGLRADRYDQYGTHATPRFSLRYQIGTDGTLRASAGRAYRMPNIISDNIHFIGTGRQYQINSIGLDIADNYGLSFAQKIYIGGPAELNLSADFYHTKFKKQNITDIESDIRKIDVNYINGASEINYLLLQNQYKINEHFGLKIAYKYTQARYRLQSNAPLFQRLYIPKHRSLLTFDYESTESHWLSNLTIQWVGTQRLLNIKQYPAAFNYGDISSASPAYVLINAHVSRHIGPFEIYTGLENASDYVQELQIIAPLSAGSRFFDATRLYAPNMGIRWYGGIKWLLL